MPWTLSNRWHLAIIPITSNSGLVELKCIYIFLELKCINEIASLVCFANCKGKGSYSSKVSVDLKCSKIYKVQLLSIILLVLFQLP